MASRLRWLVLSVFVLSTALNYLDRLLLAALAPTLKSEFHLSNTQYGGVISVFSIVYALTAPVAGWFIDRVGLNAGITVSMAVWSLAGMATGLTRHDWFSKSWTSSAPTGRLQVETSHLR